MGANSCPRKDIFSCLILHGHRYHVPGYGCIKVLLSLRFLYIISSKLKRRNEKLSEKSKYVWDINIEGILFDAVRLGMIHNAFVLCPFVIIAQMKWSAPYHSRIISYSIGQSSQAHTSRLRKSSHRLSCDFSTFATNLSRIRRFLI